MASKVMGHIVEYMDSEVQIREEIDGALGPVISDAEARAHVRGLIADFLGLGCAYAAKKRETRAFFQEDYARASQRDARDREVARYIKQLLRGLDKSYSRKILKDYSVVVLGAGSSEPYGSFAKRFGHVVCVNVNLAAAQERIGSLKKHQDRFSLVTCDLSGGIDEPLIECATRAGWEKWREQRLVGEINKALASIGGQEPEVSSLVSTCTKLSKPVALIFSCHLASQLLVYPRSAFYSSLVAQGHDVERLQDRTQAAYEAARSRVHQRHFELLHQLSSQRALVVFTDTASSNYLGSTTTMISSQMHSKAVEQFDVLSRHKWTWSIPDCTFECVGMALHSKGKTPLLIPKKETNPAQR